MTGMGGEAQGATRSGTASGKLRGRRRVSLVSALVLTAAVLGGAVGIAAASGSSGTHAVRVGLGLSCRFPSRTYEVRAEVSASFPSSAAVGSPIQPAGLEVILRLPTAAIGYLRQLDASTVSASALLTVTQAAAGTSVQTRWPAQTSAESQLPATGSLQMTAAGSALPATASAPGRVTFTASAVDLTLSPRTSLGKATSPRTVQVSCALTDGNTVELASVVVSRASASPTPSAASSAKPSGKHKVKFPKHCGDIPVVGNGVAVCGYLVGYSDVRKQYGAAKLGPGLINVDFAYRFVLRHGELVEYSKGQLYYPGTEPYYKGHMQLPPARSTFLSFGFVPVTATLVLIEKGPVKIVSVSQLNAPPYHITVTATTKTAIHVSDVSVNGRPLNVGPACRAEHPAMLKLVGHGTNTIPPKGYTVPTGGPLAGFVTIPPFIDCGVTENLDPLLSGTISGSRNYVKMTQGKLCGPTQPQNWTCPPPVRKPVR